MDSISPVFLLVLKPVLKRKSVAIVSAEKIAPAYISFVFVRNEARRKEPLCDDLNNKLQVAPD